MSDIFSKQALEAIAKEDVAVLERKQREYGDSWCKRGGVGAYFVAIRKVDRIEEQVKRHGYDVFEAAVFDPRPDGILDDLADLSRYLLLIRAKVAAMVLARNRIKTPDRRKSGAPRPLKKSL